ncbi:MAG: DHHW family protein [Pseudoflavonifractor sp.]
MKRRETLTAVLFLIATAAASLLLAVNLLTAPPAAPVPPAEGGPLAQFTAFVGSAEGKVNGALDQDHLFIQLYGGIQALSGRRVVPDMDPTYTVVTLENGALTFANPDPPHLDTTDNALALADFGDTLKAELDIPLLYVQAPQKASPQGLPPGIPDYGNEYADTVLSVLRSRGIAALDLRPVLAAAAADPATPPLFFRTDHHWTPEGAFLGYQALSQTLAQDYGFPVSPVFTDADRYTKTVYEDWFLGSQGKRVGTLYAGTDDITLWTPDFETGFTYTTADAVREGPFASSLLFPERLEPKDYFNGNPYTLYAGGDYPIATIENHLNPDGPKILLIRESFACAITPFLALDCGELTTVDLRSFEGDLMETIGRHQPDLVMVLYGASSTRVPQLFNFMR